MGSITRFGVSIDEDLLAQFDEFANRKGYTNRSEAIRDLIRDTLTHASHQDKSVDAVGSISLVYDHHMPELTQKLTAIQHDYHDAITATIHVHLDHHNCMEIIVVKGAIRQLDELANRLSVIRGVKSGKLTLVS